MRTQLEAAQYLADYVASAVEPVRETKDGYVFSLIESWEYADGTKVKVFKDSSIPLSDYKVLKK